jgi:hypothetical protein
MQHAPPVLALLILALSALACSLTATPTQPAPEPTQAARVAFLAHNPPTNTPPTQEPTQEPAPACEVIAQALNVRACPGVSCAVIGSLYTGALVQAAPAGVDGWLELTQAQGYISARWCIFPEGQTR